MIIKPFISSVTAGMMIAIGGTVFLSCDNRYVGAFLFSIGLMTILAFKLNLFTGMVGYLTEHKPSYCISLAITWLGNFIGTFITAYAIKNTRIIVNFAGLESIVQAKLNDNLLSIFILSIFCGMLMFIAVYVYKQNTNMSVVVVIMCVTVFIISGFEHCIANMFYFTLSSAWSPKSFFYLLVMTIGNSVGAVIVSLCRKYITVKNVA